MTTISRDRIQFEAFGDQVNDGNEQSHRDAAAKAWASAASEHLESRGGGEASIRIGYDHTRLSVSGDRELAEAADEAGMEAARQYVVDEIARLAADYIQRTA